MTSAVREPDDAELHASPARRIETLSRLIGEPDVAAWCAELLTETASIDDGARPSPTWVGGAHAAQELRRGDVVARGQAYWFRVWGARGLLYVWVPEAAVAVQRGLTDEAWRVREMCAKVSRVRELGETAPVLAFLLDDAVTRVRAAAAAALAVTAETEEVTALRLALDDPESSVRAAAARALEVAARRLDRPL